MTDRENDRQKAIDAEIKLRFVKDMSRLVEQMGPVSHELSQPIKRRRVTNHFLHEYEELYSRREK